jgi:signal transduction histidine kinase
MYAGFLSLVLIIISAVILVNAYFYYVSNSKAEMNETADKVEEFILSGGELTSDSLAELSSNKNIEIRVSTRDKRLDTATMINPQDYPKPEFSGEEPGENENEPEDGNIHILDKKLKVDYVNEMIENRPYMLTHRNTIYDNTMYDIQVFRPFSHERNVMTFFVILFFGIDIVAVIASVMMGRYISKRMLKSIVEITDTADSISIHDLTQRITVPEADDEVRKLVITLNDMIKRLEVSFEKQKQFVSDASHELRTPIAVIQGYINLVDRWGKSDTEVLDEAIGSIKYETEHMSKLIQELLFLARAEDNTIELKTSELDLKEIALDVIKEVNVSEPDVDISYEGESADINADSHLIQQLMWIFVQNAVKYRGDKPCKIELRTGKKDGKAFFSVKDYGIGMTEETISHIFDRFYREDKSRNKKIEGNGLGLSIAKWIIEQHKAEVKVDSEPEKYSKFTVSF